MYPEPRENVKKFGSPPSMSETVTKKRKQSNIDNDVNVPVKKLRKEKLGKKELKLKGKAEDTEFHVVKTSLVLSIPPIFTSNPRAGVEEMLDSIVMRWAFLCDCAT